MATQIAGTNNQQRHGRIFLTIFLLGLFGVITLAISITFLIPSLVASLGDEAPPPPPNIVIVLAMTVQLGILIALATWAGLTLSKRMNTNVTPILTHGISDKRLLLGLVSGVSAGLAMLIVHQLIFFPVTGIPVNVSAEMPILIGLASVFLYGGFTEEILMRLGLMTLLLWLGSKIQNDENNAPTTAIFWIVNGIVTVLFGLLHIPSAVVILDIDPTPIVVAQALVLNSVGLLFGWLYWRKGIETAFAAHIGVHVGYTLLATLLL